MAREHVALLAKGRTPGHRPAGGGANRHCPAAFSADHPPEVFTGHRAVTAAAGPVQNRRTMATLASDCVFCAIEAGRAPATVVHRDARTIAFLDTRQANPGHVLVVPRRHLPDIRDADAPTAAAVMRAVSKVARAVARAFPNDGLSIWHSIGPAADQEVPHLHSTCTRGATATACCASTAAPPGGRAVRSLTSGASGFAPPSTRIKHAMGRRHIIGALVVCSATILSGPRGASAQDQPRFEAGVQVVAAAWRQFDGSDLGIGPVRLAPGEAAGGGGRVRPLFGRFP